MRYFLFALAGAAVATLWWAVGVFGKGENGNTLGWAVVASIALLTAMISISCVENKL